MSGWSKHDDFFIIVVVGLRKCIPYFFCEQHSENQWQKSNKWQLSRHVESDSTWCDDRQILIGPFPAAADQSENSNHGGE
jgi:hypothetical protein